MENEKRLIDADMLKANFPVLGNFVNDLWPSAVVRRAIDNAPTVDAVEVVRCCSCKKHDHDGATGYCNRWDKWTKMSDFCCYGERKDNDND